MKRFVVAALLVVLALLSCVSTSSPIEEFFTLHGAVLEEGPMGFTLTSSGANALALRPVGPYTEELVCELSIQSAVSEGPRNGFLVLADRGDPGDTILAGISIGAGELSIWGSGVRESIFVREEFDRGAVFDVRVLVNLVKGFVEMRVGDREIGAPLTTHVSSIDAVGYHSDSTTTHFSEISVIGK